MFPNTLFLLNESNEILKLRYTKIHTLTEVYGFTIMLKVL